MKDKGLLPELTQGIDDLVIAMDAELRPEAAGVATRLRAAGRAVELVLDPRKLKWAFKRAERAGAARLVIVGGTEWEEKKVAVKDLATQEQTAVPLEDLC